ncbi:NADH dehydrogenase subunit 4 [Crocosphaera subtropica ATCC 51142]|uniref:NADH dehydrogenase subunit 4 n=1 Tax=Crocosphaera subtropica (strain ATCC 51142 / BH68) TaxID=43989 RepID=B1WYM6_CROS5|nr:NADH-quinone oxidoreductase subunit M [Crocosphaera subtropica]ACB51043.1 NADH dehydrogenase subunit 4 [Crocosphaera subtropica ATCC 51142]
MLTALIVIPLIGAVLIASLPSKQNDSLYRTLALVITSLLLVLTIVIGFQFDLKNPNIQFTEFIPWITDIGLNYHLGVDGLSLPLVVLNSLLTLIAIYASEKTIERSRFYYPLILILNSGVSGAFLAQDILLFFLFYELEIIPLYFLIAIWGGSKRGYAAMKFLLYTAISGFLVLASFLGLVWLSGASTFDYEPLRSHTLPLSTQLLLLAPLLIGLAIKIPIFPFHTWLPDAHVEASTPVSVLLAGVLLKLGTYGLLRFGVGLFLDAWVYIAPWLATLAAISALYGASCAIVQKDMKKVVAYSSIAHMAYILLAAAASTRLSVTAATFQMVSHGLISAMLFLLVGVVYKKTGSRDVDFLRGLLNPQRGLPITGSLIILGVMASAGIPGMVGFIAEFLVFRGSFPIFPVQTLLCLVGSGLTAVYFLLMVNRVFFGRLTPELSQIPRVLWSERLPAFVLALLIVILGIQPSWMVRWSEPQAGLLLTGQSQLEATGNRKQANVNVDGLDIS